MTKGTIINIALTIGTLLLALLNLMYGSVSIPMADVWQVLLGGTAGKASWTYIIMESRLPQTITAILCGASLATSGLLLQTAFRNPLAGPSILGITGGASLGVGIVMLATGGVISLGSSIHLSLLNLSITLAPIAGYLAVIMGAFTGSLLVIMLLLAFSHTVRSNLMLLIVGIMVGYLTTSVVSLLNFFASPDSIQSYVVWGMGSFADVTPANLPFFCTVSIIGLVLSALLIKPLNALLLGNNYAENLGVDIRRTLQLLLITTGLLTAVSTAFCGPVAFIGLAVPHMARLVTRTSNHTVLLPATILCGACVALLCNTICSLPHSTIIPLNAVTPLFGAPVILYIILSGHRHKA